MDRKTRTLIETVCLFCLALASVVPYALAAPAWTYTNISAPGSDAISCSLSGNDILYSVAVGSPFAENSSRLIRLYNRSAGNDTLLAASEPGTSLFAEDIEGNYATWSESPLPSSTQSGPNALYLYSLPKQDISVLSGNNSAAWAKISGDTMIWTEDASGSYASSVVVYTISNGTRSVLPGVQTYDPAGVSYNGRYVLYSDAESDNLTLYEPGIGNRIVVFAPTRNATVVEGLGQYALGGDYILYDRSVTVSSPRERYHELCLYRITQETTVMVSPMTGSIITTLSTADRNAEFTVQDADASRVVWDVAEGIADDKIMVLDPASGAVTSLLPKMFVDTVRIDGRNMSWIGTGELFGKGTVYLATESGDTTVSPTTPAAGLPVNAAMIPAAAFAGAFVARMVFSRRP